ncbi:Hypothetical protein A7982_00623 [Minicystis rosea]|nr:Hypothetical protein A7982_00623 [Minicystis rosea]
MHPFDLKARTLAQVAATPSPTRPDGARRTATLVLAAALSGIVLFQAAGGLEHASGRPLRLTWGIAGGWLFWSAALSWLVLRRGRSTLGARPGLLRLAALATPLVSLAWLHAFSGTYAEPSGRVGFRCLAGTLLIASPLLAALFVARRGVDPRAPRTLGCALGAVAGAWAGVLVDLWCPLTNLSHVFIGHALPLASMIGIGALAGGFALGARALPRRAA